MTKSGEVSISYIQDPGKHTQLTQLAGDDVDRAFGAWRTTFYIPGRSAGVPILKCTKVVKR